MASDEFFDQQEFGFKDESNKSSEESTDTETVPSLETDYYAILGIERQATLEEINSAFRSLSREFHPDKHPLTDATRQRDASRYFTKLKQAHEILSDETRRALYDALGHEGLEFAQDTGNMQLVSSTPHASEMRDRLKALKKLEKQLKLAKLTRAVGSVRVDINAIQLFDYLDTEKEEIFADDAESFPLPSVYVSMIHVNLATRIPVNDDMVSLGGNSTYFKGTGDAEFNTSVRRVISDKSWISVMFAIGRGPVFVLEGFRSFGLKTQVTGNLSIPLKLIAGVAGASSVDLAQFGAELTLSHLIWTNLKASVKFALGGLTYIGPGLVYTHGANRYEVSAKHGINKNSWSVEGNYSRKIELIDARILLGAKVKHKGFSFDYGLIKEVSNSSNIFAGITIDVEKGVSLKVRYSYGSQSFTFRFILYDEILASAVFYGTLVPLVTYTCIDALVIKPLKRKKQKDEDEIDKVQNADKLIEMKSEAIALQNVWISTYERIVKEESEKNGLIIILALYGSKKSISQLNLHSDIDPSSLMDVFDVKIPLQCRVKNSTLHLPSGSKIHYPGFCDPCFKQEKALYIKYKYRGIESELHLKDTNPVSIPPSNHSSIS